MPPTFQEVKAALNKAQAKERSMNTDLLQVAAVKAEELTGHPAWDKFLEQVQVLVNTAEAQAKEWTHKCVHSSKEEDMRAAQLEVCSWETQAMILRRVMAMPQAILSEYHATQS